MKNRMKRGLIIALVMSLLLMNTTVVTNAAGMESSSVSDDAECITVSVEQVLQEYQQATSEACALAIRNNRESDYYDTIEYYQRYVVDRLNMAGYEAYGITPKNNADIADTLGTNLLALGVEQDHYYVAVISTEAKADSPYLPRETPGTSFNYTYNGVTYTLRYLTLTAADNSLMGKASTVNVLQSAGQTLIQNCLDTAITTLLSAIWEPLGTVASICGLSISNINTSHTCTMYLNGGTNWTRVYTQVWDTISSEWVYGSSVEWVTGVVNMSGMYYSTATNMYTSVPASQSRKTKYSSHYSDYTWRKQNAVAGFNNLMIYYDLTGQVQYKYGGTVKITHAENF